MTVPRPEPDRGRRIRRDAGTILRFAGPLLVNNLATGGMMTADTVMAGRLGAVDLAAVALGANFTSLFYIAGLGLLLALSPTVAHAYGAGRDSEVGHFFRQGLWLALGLGLLIVLGMLAVRPVLAAMDTAPEVADLAARYVYAVAFGMPALMGFLALRFASEGIGWTRPVMYTAVLALGANIAGNYVFMYGKLGMPELGAVGCGVATALSQWLIFGVMWIYVRRHHAYRKFRPLQRFEVPDARGLREVLRLGLPISGGILAEGSLFSVAALILGSFGATVVAAHAIALSYAALMFMVPLSLASATTIHVGHRVGAGDREGGRWAGWTGAAMGTLLMAVSALVLLVLREPIAALYTRDAVVLALASTLLLYAAVFQLADGLQVAMAGALRGFKDATVPMLLCIASYWGVGFSLAYYLGVIRGRGAPGIWIGLIAGLFAAALLLTLRYRIISRRPRSETARR